MQKSIEKYKYAFLKSLPVMFGYVFLGTAFGILLQQAGYNALWALCMSIFVYAGSMQFVMVPLLASAASPLTMAVTTLFINGRHIFYGISFVESFRKIPQYLYMIFSLTDETYSVFCGCRNEDPDETLRSTWFLISLFDQSYWVLGSVIGALLGQALPIDFTGIDFSMTALFIVILIEQILNTPGAALPAALSGMLSGLLCLLLFGADRFLLPALLITVVLLIGYTAASKGISPKKGGNRA